MKEHDLVVLTDAIPEHGLEGGDVGTIVHRYSADAVFEIEFMSAEGRTIAVLTLPISAIRPMEQNEILHARRLAPTG